MYEASSIVPQDVSEAFPLRRYCNEKQRSMRLAVVASHPIQYQAPLFRELARRVDLTVFFSHRATQLDQAKAGFGVGFDWDVDLLGGYKHAFLCNVARTPGLERFGGCDTPDVRKRLAEGRFDAVLVQGWHFKCYIQTLLAGKSLGIPVLVRGDSQLETPRSAVKKLIKAAAYPPFLRMFDAALYVGERSRAYWTRYFYPANRLFFSPHCVDADWFAQRSAMASRQAMRKELGLADDINVVLFAGKLIPVKRPLDLVVAAARLKNAGCKLAIMVAGDGPLRESMLATAEALGVNVCCLGFRNQTDMPAIYAAADVLVLMSDSETWGLVANEALACGRPIVVSDAAGCAPDLAADGMAGRVYTTGDVDALADALSDILSSPPAAANIERKSAAYSVSAAADGVVQALTAVTSRSALA